MKVSVDSQYPLGEFYFYGMRKIITEHIPRIVFYFHAASSPAPCPIHVYASDCQNARPATEPGCSVQSGLAAVKSSVMC